MMKQPNWILKEEKAFGIGNQGVITRYWSQERDRMQQNGNVTWLKSSMWPKTSRINLNIGVYDWDMEHICDDKVRVGHGYK